MIRKLALLATTAAVAAGGVAPAAMAKATHPGTYSVTKTVYVFHDPGVHFDGTAFKKNTFKVERISKSGKWAYGMAYGHINRHVWISTSALTPKSSY
jgi:hypothetical protein